MYLPKASVCFFWMQVEEINQLRGDLARPRQIWPQRTGTPFEQDLATIDFDSLGVYPSTESLASFVDGDLRLWVLAPEEVGCGQASHTATEDGIGFWRLVWRGSIFCRLGGIIA